MKVWITIEADIRDNLSVEKGVAAYMAGDAIMAVLRKETEWNNPKEAIRGWRLIAATLVNIPEGSNFSC